VDGRTRRIVVARRAGGAIIEAAENLLERALMAGNQSGAVWRLYRGAQSVAELVVVEADWPWMSAKVETAPGFAEVRELFEADLRAAERVEDDDSDEALAAADTAQQRIRDAVRLTYPDGADVPEFMLHVDGDQAWWRWSDTPFADDE
jgi:hypothetical protein